MDQDKRFLDLVHVGWIPFNLPLPDGGSTCLLIRDGELAAIDDEDVSIVGHVVLDGVYDVKDGDND